jgi:hypothetical protein
MSIRPVLFPGSGISANLADKAGKLGIPLLDHRKNGGAPSISATRLCTSERMNAVLSSA